jgi:hypothetical protein
MSRARRSPLLHTAGRGVRFLNGETRQVSAIRISRAIFQRSGLEFSCCLTIRRRFGE